VTLTQLEAFALTLLIECLTAFALARPFKLSPLACAFTAVLATACTHPLLWAVYESAWALLGHATTPSLELAVMLIETIFYRTLAAARWLDAAILSLVVNGASWGAGELIYALA
jgi:hypothetical protein